MHTINPANQLTRKRTKQLEQTATKEGLTVEEYLFEHPEYKMTKREMQKHGNKVLRVAARRLSELSA